MTIVAFPTPTPRYGGPVVTEAVTFDDEQDSSVEHVAARLVAGDEAALEEVYDRWSALVHTYALRALGDAHDAEDATQQVFVAAWHSRHTLTPSPSALPAWLIGIARHTISDVRAARARDARRAEAAMTVDGVGITSEQSVEHDVAEQLVIRQVVQDLPDPRKTILFLAFWEGQSHAEISESTGLPLGTVKSHVRRGLIHIQQQLEGVRRESR